MVGPHWEQRVVMELDSALNKWKGSVPNHRTLHGSSSSDGLLTRVLHSSVGCIARRYRVLLPIRDVVWRVLFFADRDTPAVGGYARKNVGATVPVSDYLPECCPLDQSYSGARH